MLPDDRKITHKIRERTQAERSARCSENLRNSEKAKEHKKEEEM